MSSPKILVVDDDLPLRTLMQNLLREFSYEPLLAKSGDEALAIARATPPDVILLDLNMPGLSGEETIAALKKEPELASVPIMILTGEPMGRAELERLGAWGGVQKPFDLPRLLAAIREAIATRR